MTIRKIWQCALITLVMTSCANYHITTESLLEQLQMADHESPINDMIPFRVEIANTVYGNTLSKIKVLDHKQHECVIPITNETGLRITKKDGSSELFYFDTLLLQDSSMTGKSRRFYCEYIQPILLSSIQKIEVQ